MVASLSAIASASYYLALAREDYYTSGGEPVGHWMGEAAVTLGFGSEVSAKALSRLLDGYEPKHVLSPLVQNAGKKSRRAGWDITFNAPKSVSVLWGTTLDPAVRHEIQAAQTAAVQAATRYLEKSVGFSRVGKGGSDVVPAKLLFATFEHGTSRALDPHLHTHALLVNLARRGDGSWGTIDGRLLFARHQKLALGALYRAELSHQLATRLGLPLSQHDWHFEIDGVPTREFSERRLKIEEVLQDKNLETAVAAAIVALDTREVKDVVPPRSELFARWEREGEELSFSPESIPVTYKRPNNLRAMNEGIKSAISELTEKNSYFTYVELLQKTASRLQVGFSAEFIQEQVHETVNGLVSLGHDLYTTHEIVDLEQEAIDIADDLSGNFTHLAEVNDVIRTIANYETITTEQAQAVFHLTNDSGALALVSGMAGTGKTFMLNICREIWESAGFCVLGSAIAAKAAGGLESGAGISSCSVAKLSHQIERGQRALDEKTVLVVDEAGMIPTMQLLRLIRLVKKANAKLVLIGDPKQLQPIKAGAPFRALLNRHEHISLSNIRRQRPEVDPETGMVSNWKSRAVSEFAQGNAAAALAEFEKRGLLEISADKDELLGKLVMDWKVEGVLDPGANIILAGTKSDVFALNARCQLERQQSETVDRNDAIRFGSELICCGDRVLLGENSVRYDVKNGDLGTVVAFDRQNGQMTIDIDGRDSATELDYQDYAKIQLGYALTTHKAQGMTVENAYVLAGGWMQDLHLSYVQASRARGETKIFVHENGGISFVAEMAREREKTIALDVQRDI